MSDGDQPAEQESTPGADSTSPKAAATRGRKGKGKSKGRGAAGGKPRAAQSKAAQSKRAKPKAKAKPAQGTKAKSTKTKAAKPAKSKATQAKAAKRKATQPKATRAGRKSTTRRAKTGARSGPRAPQGKRLGGWELVRQDEVFAYLARHKVTIAALARRLNVGPSAIHAWKAGRRFPSEEAQKLLRALVRGQAAPPAPVRASAAKAPEAAFDGAALRAAREARGYSRVRLAADLGVSAGSVRNWEAGDSAPRGENLTRLQRFMATAPASGPPSAAPRSRAADAGEPESAVQGAAQVAAAYVAAGHKLRPDEVVAFVASLRAALS